MLTERLKMKNDLRKWVDDGALTLLKVPLKERTNGGRLGVFGFHIEQNMLQVAVSGFDRPGVLAYLAQGFKRFELSAEACAGEKLKHSQGSHFEFTSSFENLDKLTELYEYLLLDGGLPPSRLVPFDKVYDLFAEVPHDQTGLLSPMADLLAEKNVNLRKFRADKEDGLFGVDDKSTCPVSVFARLEVPVALDLGRLHQQLVEACPEGSEVTLRSVFELVDGRPKKTNRTVTLQN